ncbi:MAG TPA: pilus assembly protein PilP [Syntrophales bacterium]|nr:pilus assembly protein PilP [Syntrophales bacterium]
MSSWKRPKPARNKRIAAFFGHLFVVLVVLYGAAVSAAEISAQKTGTFPYEKRGKVDPFKPLIRKEAAVQKEQSAFLSPLQRYNIEELKLVGIMSSEKKRVAIVEDPKGKSYVISKGTLVGRNNGMVAGVLDDRIIVEERTSGNGKEVKTKRIILNLHRVEPEVRL